MRKIIIEINGKQVYEEDVLPSAVNSRMFILKPWAKNKAAGKKWEVKVDGGKPVLKLGSPEAVQKLVDAYQAGIKVPAIAVKYRVSETTIRDRLISAGVYIRN